MWLKAFNIVGFQLVWLACVAGAGSGLVWVGPMAAVIFAAATLLYGEKSAADLRVLMVALPIGFALDGAFAGSGWLRYAQAWPSRPVRWVVGYAPGGGNDIVARLMGQWFSDRLGVPRDCGRHLFFDIE